MIKIKDLPINERPRERLIKYGPKALSDAELLAIILRLGNIKENVIDLAKKLLTKYSIASLSRRTVNNLKKNFGIGETKACQIIACFELARRLSVQKTKIKKSIKTPRDIVKLIQPELFNLKNEHFIGIYLDSRNKIIKKETIFIGTLDISIVHPREIFKIALLEGAKSIILVHNHPSNDPKPSQDDIDITKKLIKAGQLIGINILDHIIITNNNYFSMKRKNVI